ncbi:MAG: hypothetical protein ACP5MU_02295 [Thermoplasmata archaeon]
MDNRNMKYLSGAFGILASLFFVVYLFQWAHTILTGVLYTSIALLAYALASYLLIGKTTSNVVRMVPLAYLVVGLSLVYVVVVLAGGSNTFLYLALTTALIAGISFFSSSYATGISHGAKRAVKIH